jgi:hypothetical protein
MNSQQPPLMNANCAADNVAQSAAHRRQIIRRRPALWARWLHIYLSKGRVESNSSTERKAVSLPMVFGQFPARNESG